jgi:hypothetical protein
LLIVEPAVSPVFSAASTGAELGVLTGTPVQRLFAAADADEISLPADE